jgi:rhodanese-related sulfurtransferase
LSINSITAPRATELVKQGATLIDIREANEHGREKIAASQNFPLSKLKGQKLEAKNAPVVFYCLSGNRTRMNTELLQTFAGGDIFLLEGGISAWKSAGLPTLKDTKQPIEMMRQVQIAAGSLVVLGAILGLAVTPAFYALSAAVGAGLMFSGISGTCAMATILKRMPWNSAV